MRDRLLVWFYLVLAALPVTATALHVRKLGISGALPDVTRPAPTLAGIGSEKFQPKLVSWFESKLRLRGYAMYAENTILEAVFGETKPDAEVAIGTDHVLFPREDLDAFNRSFIVLDSRVDVLADRIAELQRRLKSQHRALVPVLIPSKTTVYRDKIGPRWTVDFGSDRPSDELYRRMRRALDLRHVEYVDARSVIDAEPRDRMWGLDARHWSTYAACRTMQRVLDRYGRITSTQPPPYECNLALGPAAETDDDRDLLRLLNASSKPAGVLVATAVHHETSQTKLSVVFEGSSFCTALVKDATHSSVFGRTLQNYYNRTFVEWPSEVRTEVHPHSDPWRRLVLDNDLYVIDLFESFLPTPTEFLEEVIAELDP